MRYFLILALLLCSFPTIAAPLKITETKNGFILENRFRREHVVPTIPEIKELLPSGEQSEVLCLALNIHREARGSSQDDMWGSGHVVMSHAYGKESICKTVFNVRYRAVPRGKPIPSGLFSWTVDRRKMTLVLDESWCLSQRIAYAIYIDPDAYNPIGDRRHFWNPKKANPAWAKKATDKIKVGSHIYANLPSD